MSLRVENKAFFFVLKSICFIFFFDLTNNKILLFSKHMSLRCRCFIYKNEVYRQGDREGKGKNAGSRISYPAGRFFFSIFLPPWGKGNFFGGFPFPTATLSIEWSRFISSIVSRCREFTIIKSERRRVDAISVTIALKIHWFEFSKRDEIERNKLSRFMFWFKSIK